MAKWLLMLTLVTMGPAIIGCEASGKVDTDHDSGVKAKVDVDTD